MFKNCPKTWGGAWTLDCKAVATSNGDTHFGFPLASLTGERQRERSLLHRLRILILLLGGCPQGTPLLPKRRTGPLSGSIARILTRRSVLFGPLPPPY